MHEREQSAVSVGQSRHPLTPFDFLPDRQGRERRPCPVGAVRRLFLPGPRHQRNLDAIEPYLATVVENEGTAIGGGANETLARMLEPAAAGRHRFRAGLADPRQNRRANND